MSLNRVPSSLKSSVGSKSTTVHLGGSGGGEGGSFCIHDERNGTFYNSSWVSRLQPRLLSRPRAEPLLLPPPRPSQQKSDPGLPRDVVTVSTDESRTRTSISNPTSSFVVRRYFNLFEQRTAAIPPPRLPAPPRIVVDDGGDQSVNGFGPFQFRSISSALPRVRQERVEDIYNCSGKALGKDCHGEGGGYFPLFRRMAHVGEELDGERGNLGSRVGRQRPVHAEEQFDNSDACFTTRSVPVCHNQVKLSPFFQFRPPPSNCSYPIDTNKRIVGYPTSGGCTKILENQTKMRPASSGNWNSPLPISYFPQQGVADNNQSWRRYERNLSADPWHSGASIHHVARSRSNCYDNGADKPASISTSHDHPRVFHQNMVGNHLEKMVCINEPEEAISRLNTGRFKRSAKFDDTLPLKFRKLSNDD
ncbi:hypothetical protein Cni_G24023 [Canna indica]|uniref:Uncharacterized protein n=1 Tax=Canna indica TaxID=4628 RepID=A0AAQ3L1L3_9LILI|nr:hypothetical protein Cni_G24023 [Canna indica]